MSRKAITAFVTLAFLGLGASTASAQFPGDRHKHVRSRVYHHLER